MMQSSNSASSVLRPQWHLRWIPQLCKPYGQPSTPWSWSCPLASTERSNPIQPHAWSCCRSGLTRVQGPLLGRWWEGGARVCSFLLLPSCPPYFQPLLVMQPRMWMQPVSFQSQWVQSLHFIGWKGRKKGVAKNEGTLPLQSLPERMMQSSFTPVKFSTLQDSLCLLLHAWMLISLPTEVFIMNLLFLQEQ